MSHLYLSATQVSQEIIQNIGVIGTGRMGQTVAEHLEADETDDQTRDVLRRVAANRPPVTAARDAYETMRITFAVEASAELQRTVKIDQPDA